MLFASNSRDRFSILSSVLRDGLGDQGERSEKSVSIPGQLQAPIRLCLVPTAHRYIRVLPEPINVRDKILDLFFYIFEFLRAFV